MTRRYYLIECSQHWYCVPEYNVLTSTKTTIAVGQEVKFLYSETLTFTGVIKYCSSKIFAIT